MAPSVFCILLRSVLLWWKELKRPLKWGWLANDRDALVEAAAHGIGGFSGLGSTVHIKGSMSGGRDKTAVAMSGGALGAETRPATPVTQVAHRPGDSSGSGVGAETRPAGAEDRQGADTLPVYPLDSAEGGGNAPSVFAAFITDAGVGSKPNGVEVVQGAETRPPSSGSFEALAQRPYKRSGSGLGAETRPLSPLVDADGGGNAPIGVDALREALANETGCTLLSGTMYKGSDVRLATGVLTRPGLWPRRTIAGARWK